MDGRRGQDKGEEEGVEHRTTRAAVMEPCSVILSISLDVVRLKCLITTRQPTAGANFCHLLWIVCTPRM